MSQSSTPAGESVYRPSLGKLLTKHILLCLVVVGFFTLPAALVRRSKTRLVVTDTTVSYATGVASTSQNDIPMFRVDNVNVERSVWDRMYGCGTLVISAGGGSPVRCSDLAHVGQARADIQARVALAQRRGQT